MDALLGLVLLVAVIWVVRAALGGTGTRTVDRESSRRGNPPGTGGTTRQAPPTTNADAERRRQDRADEAFIDGVLFAHYFDPFDRFGDRIPPDEGEDEAYWGDDEMHDDWDDSYGEDWGDDWDDGFHDDAGDW